MSYTKLINKTAQALILCLSFSAYADGVPGIFDYYLLTLSWSPQFCSGAVLNDSNINQCGSEKKFGFVVHGLWPQYNKGFPDTCNPNLDVPEAVVQKMLPIMPSERLIQHEWAKHGTCSGITVAGYFDLIQHSFEAIKIPADFINPSKSIKTTTTKIRKQFQDLNPNSQMAFTCKGNYLQEIRFCFDTKMQPQACGAEVKDHCPASSVIISPVN